LRFFDLEGTFAAKFDRKNRAVCKHTALYSATDDRHISRSRHILLQRRIEWPRIGFSLCLRSLETATARGWSGPRAASSKAVVSHSLKENNSGVARCWQWVALTPPDAGCQSNRVAEKIRKRRGLILWKNSTERVKKERAS